MKLIQVIKANRGAIIMGCVGIFGAIAGIIAAGKVSRAKAFDNDDIEVAIEAVMNDDEDDSDE